MSNSYSSVLRRRVCRHNGGKIALAYFHAAYPCPGDVCDVAFVSRMLSYNDVVCFIHRARRAGFRRVFSAGEQTKLKCPDAIASQRQFPAEYRRATPGILRDAAEPGSADHPI